MMLSRRQAAGRERRLMAVCECECSNRRNRRQITDTQPADVNVGYGASSLNNPMSAVSLKRSLLGKIRLSAARRFTEIFREQRVASYR